MEGLGGCDQLAEHDWRRLSYPPRSCDAKCRRCDKKLLEGMGLEEGSWVFSSPHPCRSGPALGVKLSSSWPRWWASQDDCEVRWTATLKLKGLLVTIDCLNMLPMACFKQGMLTHGPVSRHLLTMAHMQRATALAHTADVLPLDSHHTWLRKSLTFANGSKGYHDGGFALANIHDIESGFLNLKNHVRTLENMRDAVHPLVVLEGQEASAHLSERLSSQNADWSGKVIWPMQAGLLIADSQHHRLFTRKDTMAWQGRIQPFGRKELVSLQIQTLNDELI